MAAISDVLRRLGLLAAGAPDPPIAELAGGVSSDIWRVDLVDGPVCVKRARPRLKVAARWEAPVTRSRYEAAYLRDAAAIAPGHVPRLLAEDREAGVLVEEWLDPQRYRCWKAELLAGVVDSQTTEMVGRILVAIHAATAADATVAERYDSLQLFEALRLEPYLDATAARHPDLARPLAARREAYLANRRVLVHGDVSPKNILVGPTGPVLLDAECATFGDAAFDVAFCLTHLLLKCAHRPAAAAPYLDAVARLAAAYLTGVSWEPAAGLERRVAELVPALVLARVDGKSPVEYLDEPARDDVRRAIRPLVARPPARLGELARAWSRAWR